MSALVCVRRLSLRRVHLQVTLPVRQLEWARASESARVQPRGTCGSGGCANIVFVRRPSSRLGVTAERSTPVSRASWWDHGLAYAPEPAVGAAAGLSGRVAADAAGSVGVTAGELLTLVLDRRGGWRWSRRCRWRD